MLVEMIFFIFFLGCEVFDLGQIYIFFKNLLFLLEIGVNSKIFLLLEMFLGFDLLII